MGVSLQTMCAGEDCISHFTLTNPITHHVVLIALPLVFLVLFAVLLWSWCLMLMDCCGRASVTRWKPRPRGTSFASQPPSLSSHSTYMFSFGPYTTIVGVVPNLSRPRALLAHLQGRQNIQMTRGTVWHNYTIGFVCFLRLNVVHDNVNFEDTSP